MSFSKNSFIHIKNAISKDVIELVVREFNMMKENLSVIHNDKNKFAFNDKLVPKSFSWYSPLIFESLSDTLVKKQVEKVLKKKVYPTYTYGRIYYKGSKLPQHKDRISSEYSATLCLTSPKNNINDLYLIDKNNKRINFRQKPGDLVLYEGSKLRHGRDTLKCDEQMSAFFFYVSAKGKKSFLKYDTRPCLGLSYDYRKYDNDTQESMVSE